MSTTDAIVVSYDYREDKDNAVLIVGRKRLNESMEIINAFDGEEAKELYAKLTGLKQT